MYEPWPVEFYTDFMEIAQQEAQHFLSWTSRLEEGYGLRCVLLGFKNEVRDAVGEEGRGNWWIDRPMGLIE
jgi:hypothetical protein